MAGRPKRRARLAAEAARRAQEARPHRPRSARPAIEFLAILTLLSIALLVHLLRGTLALALWCGKQVERRSGKSLTLLHKGGTLPP